MAALYQAARGIMRADGNFHQWDGPYPNEETALRDIARGCSYMMEEEGVPVATFAFIPDIEPTYAKIYGGQWLDVDAPYATIHRLASTPESSSVAQNCFSWCWERCREQGRNLRIDTHRDNRIMRHVIEKFGFEYCGVILLADGAERLAYQKLQ